jgi:hypothetical protein
MHRIIQGVYFIKEFTTKYNTIKRELVNFPRSCVVVFWFVPLSSTAGGYQYSEGSVTAFSINFGINVTQILSIFFHYRCLKYHKAKANAIDYLQTDLKL